MVTYSSLRFGKLWIFNWWRKHPAAGQGAGAGVPGSSSASMSPSGEEESAASGRDRGDEKSD